MVERLGRFRIDDDWGHGGNRLYTRKGNSFAPHGAARDPVPGGARKPVPLISVVSLSHRQKLYVREREVGSVPAELYACRKLACGAARFAPVIFDKIGSGAG